MWMLTKMMMMMTRMGGGLQGKMASDDDDDDKNLFLWWNFGVFQQEVAEVPLAYSSTCRPFAKSTDQFFDTDEFSLLL